MFKDIIIQEYCMLTISVSKNIPYVKKMCKAIVIKYFKNIQLKYLFNNMKQVGCLIDQILN